MGGATFWATHDHGAIIIRIEDDGLTAQTFLTRQQWRPRPRLAARNGTSERKIQLALCGGGKKIQHLVVP
jgi:hypothetical protein